MRAAEIEDLWNALARSPEREVELVSFQVQDLAGLGNLEVEFSSPVTAFCGLSGTGKSAVLQALKATLEGVRVEQNVEVGLKLNGSRAGAVVSVGGEKLSLHAEMRIDDEPSYDEEERNFEIVYLDLSRYGPKLQEFFCDLEIEELLDAYTPISVDESDRRIINYVCKKSYSDIEIFEIDEFGDNVPFVKVSDDSGDYDSRTMSLGENSILLIYWTLKRSKPGSIILLEEPETFIPPVSQSALVNLLVGASVKSKITIVYTTHSPEMFSRMSPNQVKFLYKNGAKSSVATENEHAAMKKLVGFYGHKDVIVLVEDRAARVFLTRILAKLSDEMSARCEVVEAEGSGGIVAALKSFPRRILSTRLVGVFDGDMRQKSKT